MLQEFSYEEALGKVSRAEKIYAWCAVVVQSPALVEITAAQAVQFIRACGHDWGYRLSSEDNWRTINLG